METTVILTEQDAKLFIEFQKRYEFIAPLVGYLDALKVMDTRNMQLVLDVDNMGVVRHTSITKHFR